MQDEVIVINDGDGDVDGNLVRGVLKKEDPVDRSSVSKECTFPRQERVNPGKNDQLVKAGETLGYGKRKITPRMLFSPKPKGKTDVSKAITGVGFPQIKK